MGAYRGEITSVTLRRGPCFGACPVYEVTLGADGSAKWNGERFVERLGRFRGEVRANDYAHLAGFVERAGFFHWDPEYVGHVSDLPDYHLTVVSGSGTKSVRQNAVDDPADFWVIAALVDGIAAAVDWTPLEGDPQAGGEPRLANLHRLPPAESWRRINFERAQVLTLESDPPQYLLTVSGTKPYLNMEVQLVPLTYIRQPEYWGIEVIGRLPGAGLPTVSSYTVSLPLSGFIGSTGIEVIGADRTELIDVPPAEQQLGTCSDWSAVHDHQPPGPSVLRVGGTCRFPTAGYSVQLRRHEPQGINPTDLLLDRIVQAPGGPVAEVVSEVEVSYSEETELDYQTVTIVPGGPTIQVQDVQ